MKTSAMVESKYLKQDDIGEGKLVTISGLKRVNLAQEGDAPEFKWTISFEELDKPMVLNSTNIQLCERACGSDDTDDWIGKRIVLYVDENVSFGGKIVGGIRIRKPKSPSAVKPPVQSDDSFADDIPF